MTHNKTTQTPRILLSGASGMLGHAAAKALQAQGFLIVRLVRRPTASPDELRWHPEPGGHIEHPERLEGITAAIHLSGASIAGHRWTRAYKQEMWQSRVETTTLLAGTLARLTHPPATLVVASGVGYYGDRGEALLDESSTIGSGFFPELCLAWEQAASPAAAAGIRVVHSRMGMVVGPDGGAMQRLIPLFRLGLGGKLGNGRQWMPWISLVDAVAIMLFAIECPALAGAVNAVSPQPVTNAEFTRALGRAVHRPAILPAPAFALRLALGEMADAALLASARVLPARLIDAGYLFRLATLDTALAATLAAALDATRAR